MATPAQVRAGEAFEAFETFEASPQQVHDLRGQRERVPLPFLYE